MGTSKWDSPIPSHVSKSHWLLENNRIDSLLEVNQKADHSSVARTGFSRALYKKPKAQKQPWGSARVDGAGLSWNHCHHHPYSWLKQKPMAAWQRATYLLSGQAHRDSQQIQVGENANVTTSSHDHNVNRQKTGLECQLWQFKKFQRGDRACVFLKSGILFSVS